MVSPGGGSLRRLKLQLDSRAATAQPPEVACTLTLLCLAGTHRKARHSSKYHATTLTPRQFTGEVKTEAEEEGQKSAAAVTTAAAATTAAATARASGSNNVRQVQC
jgi:hypothetical protein